MMFSVRIVTTDHYQATPIPGLDPVYAEFTGSEVKKVPVVRIFGATPAGQKTCMHVHGVFPYLYVPYDGTAPWDRYLRQFATSLDKAINVAGGKADAGTRHVYKITLVSGIPMYGYHPKEQQFLKIYLYNPQMVRKVADLLLGGAVLNKSFQPHESHIPYTLQLFIDYNLYGMNMINVCAVKFRRKTEDGEVEVGSGKSSQSSDQGIWSPATPLSSLSTFMDKSGSSTPKRMVWQSENIPSELLLPSKIVRDSTCELEVDVVAADILNRLEVNANVGANPGLAALWEDERQRCAAKGGDPTNIAPPDSQDRGDVASADSEIQLLERLREIVLQQQPYIDSQSENGSQGSEEEEEIPATPASDVQLHLSQREDDLMSSQDTVMLDEEEFEAAPVINVDSIQRVISSSQSFTMAQRPPHEPVIGSQEENLAQLLLDLAEDGDLPSSQRALSQVAALEEQDSILAGTMMQEEEEKDEGESKEELEMSQRIWITPDGEEVDEEDEKKRVIGEEAMEEYDLEGMDDTWHDSQWVPPDKSDSEEEDVIPQYDGPSDEKPTKPKKTGPGRGRKRLGVHGPVSYSQSPRAPGPERGAPVQQYGQYCSSTQEYPSASQQQQYDNHGYSNYNYYNNQWGTRMNANYSQVSPTGGGGGWNQGWANNSYGSSQQGYCQQQSEYYGQQKMAGYGQYGYQYNTQQYNSSQYNNYGYSQYPNARSGYTYGSSSEGGPPASQVTSPVENRTSYFPGQVEQRSEFNPGSKTVSSKMGTNDSNKLPSPIGINVPPSSVISEQPSPNVQPTCMISSPVRQNIQNVQLSPAAKSVQYQQRTSSVHNVPLTQHQTPVTHHQPFSSSYNQIPSQNNSVNSSYQNVFPEQFSPNRQNKTFPVNTGQMNALSVDTSFSPPMPGNYSHLHQQFSQELNPAEGAKKPRKPRKPRQPRQPKDPLAPKKPRKKRTPKVDPMGQFSPTAVNGLGQQFTSNSQEGLLRQFSPNSQKAARELLNVSPQEISGRMTGQSGFQTMQGQTELQATSISPRQETLMIATSQEGLHMSKSLIGSVGRPATALQSGHNSQPSNTLIGSQAHLHMSGGMCSPIQSNMTSEKPLTALQQLLAEPEDLEQGISVNKPESLHTGSRDEGSLRSVSRSSTLSSTSSGFMDRPLNPNGSCLSPTQTSPLVSQLLGSSKSVDTNRSKSSADGQLSHSGSFSSQHSVLNDSQQDLFADVLSAQRKPANESSSVCSFNNTRIGASVAKSSLSDSAQSSSQSAISKETSRLPTYDTQQMTIENQNRHLKSVFSDSVHHSQSINFSGSTRLQGFNNSNVAAEISQSRWTDNVFTEPTGIQSSQSAISENQGRLHGYNNNRPKADVAEKRRSDIVYTEHAQPLHSKTYKDGSRSHDSATSKKGSDLYQRNEQKIGLSLLSSLETLVGNVNREKGYGSEFGTDIPEHLASSVPGLSTVGQGMWNSQPEPQSTSPAPTFTTLTTKCQSGHQKEMSLSQSWNSSSYFSNLLNNDDFDMTGLPGQTAPQAHSPFKRSISVPGEKGRLARMKKLGLVSRHRSLSTVGDMASKSVYKFNFHVPTPVYKHLKLRHRLPPATDDEEIKVVRMHPMDARRYSLLKIGREVVKVEKLSDSKISKIKEYLKLGGGIGNISFLTLPVAKRSQSDPVEKQDSHTEPVMPLNNQGDNFNEQVQYQGNQMTPHFNTDLRSDPSQNFENNFSQMNSGFVNSGTISQFDFNAQYHPGFGNAQGLFSTAFKRKRGRPRKSESFETRADVKDRDKQQVKKRRNKSKNANIAPGAGKLGNGFPYLGKRMAKRLSKFPPVLDPELEEDGNVILRDVSLTEAYEGTLTPLKSRTPVAGRSPSHCGGTVEQPILTDLETVDSKLKSLASDLDSPASKMFGNEMFTQKDPCLLTEDVKDNLSDKEEDMEEVRTETEEEVDEKEKEFKNSLMDDEETLSLDENIVSDILGGQKQKLEEEEECKDVFNVNNKTFSDKEDEVCVTPTEKMEIHIEKEVSRHKQDPVGSVKDKDIPQYVVIHKGTEKDQKEDVQKGSLSIRLKLKEKGGNDFVVVSQKERICPDDVKVELEDILHVKEKDGEEGSFKSDRLENESDTNKPQDDTVSDLRNMTERTSKHSLSKSETNVHVSEIKTSVNSSLISEIHLSNSDPHQNKIAVECGSYTGNESGLENRTFPAKRNSKSSSCDSRSAYSGTCSSSSRRQSSRETDELSSLFDDDSSSQTQFKRKHKRRRRKRMKTKKMRSRRREVIEEEDDDGIEGVDFIIVGKFRGFKSMRVLLENVKVDENSVVVASEFLAEQSRRQEKLLKQKYAGCRTPERNTSLQVESNKKSPISGFSLEFEKFLASTSPSFQTDKSPVMGTDKVKQRRNKLSLKKTQMAKASSPVSNRKFLKNGKRKTVKGSVSGSLLSTLSTLHDATMAKLSECKYSPSKTESSPRTISITLDNREVEKRDSSGSTGMSLESDSGSSCEHSASSGELNGEHEIVNKFHSDHNLIYRGHKHTPQFIDEVVSQSMHGPNSTLDAEHKLNSHLVGHLINQRANKRNGKIASLAEKKGSAGDGLYAYINDVIEREILGDNEVEMKNVSCDGSEFLHQKNSVKLKEIIRKQNDRRKKKSGSIHNRMSRAFLSIKPRRRKPANSGGGKLMTSLSVLHEATLAQLVKPESQENNPEVCGIDGNDKVQESEGDGTLEKYGEKLEDYQSDYNDTMYSLAMLSPFHSEVGETSPPQPLSPEEFLNSCEDNTDISESLQRTPSSVADLVGLSKSSNSLEMLKDTTSCCRNSQESFRNGESKYEKMLTKTAVVKLTSLTLRDIQKDVTSCSGESDSETKCSKTEQNISPPDLGPPNIPRFSPRLISMCNGGAATPPHLTPYRSPHRSPRGADCHVLPSGEGTGARMAPALLPRSHRMSDSSDGDPHTVPPPLTPHQSPRRFSCSDSNMLGDSDFRNYSDLDYQRRVGLSPAACSSTGSINVVRSEEFSDISDDDDVNNESEPVLCSLSSQGSRTFGSDSGIIKPSPQMVRTFSGNSLKKESERNERFHTNIFQLMSCKMGGGCTQPEEVESLPNVISENIEFSASQNQSLPQNMPIQCPTKDTGTNKTDVLHETRNEKVQSSFGSSDSCSSGRLEAGSVSDSSRSLFSNSALHSVSLHSQFSIANSMDKGVPSADGELATSALMLSALVSSAFHTQGPSAGVVTMGTNKRSQKSKTPQSNQSSNSNKKNSDNRDEDVEKNDEGAGKEGGSGERLNRSVRNEDSKGSRSHVITPQIPAPSGRSIVDSAVSHGLSTVHMQEAFYGNPRDAPEKARELGGHVLKVQSNSVKTLPDFSSNVKCEGLSNWRTILCANEGLCASQNERENIFEKFSKDSELKYVLNGDKQIVIGPCAVPPSRQKVEEWLKGKQLYEHLKKQVQETKKSETVKSDKEQVKKDNAEMKKRKLEKVADITEPTTSDSGVHSKITDTEETLKHIDKGGYSSPPHKLAKIEEMDQLHSTPVIRRSSVDLFELECTPIVSDKTSEAGAPEEGDGEFVTPKRIKPLRRLSSNTDTTLRRAIITSQMKHQFATPEQGKGDVSQIDGPTPRNSFGFKVSQQNFQDAKALHEHQYLTVISLEIHADTRGDLRPDPQVDPIRAIFYSIFNDVPPDSGERHITGAIIVDKNSANKLSSQLSHDLMSANPRRGRLSPSPGSSKSHDLKPSNQKRRRSPSPTPGTSKSHDLKATNQKGRRSPSPKPGTSHDNGGQSSRRGGRSSPTPGPSTAPDPGGPSDGDGHTILEKSGVAGLRVVYVQNEEELFKFFVQFVLQWDPDILVGYEVQMFSWGYLLERASQLSLNLAVAISRIPQAKQSSHFSAEKDEYGADYASEIHIGGRIVLNLWRLLRHETALNIYTFENVAFHVLHQRIPLFSFRSLTSWFNHKTSLHRWKVIDHYVTRVKGNLQLIDQLDLIGRTSEFARVFGIEFYHVLSRGSQYRVESMMLRVAKPMNFIPVSPSVHQRARMKAPECIALTLEPKSRFYTHPVVVLDFQSLYPSIMIAYNYCFSTCLGRLDWLQQAQDGPIEFGCTSLNISPSELKKVKDDVTVSPNGIVFLKQSVRRGVLPIMVEEILKTRLMVKKAMKGYRDDKSLYRLLDARQLGMKLIANVTYGYTAANFSGRMPCVEVADSIVRKARETLERAIKLVEDTPEWGAQVVYGDTDSMFLLMKGRTKDEAFKIGQEIADAVTAMNPKPIKLKFEKVYLPCVLQTKKRYVGFMYETPDQKEPVYDAKGIETVRRDACPAVAKILERSIKILFTSRDVSQVKSYVQQQCRKLMEGVVSVQDCVFAKEYRGMPGYKPGACVPGLEIAKKCLRQDKRSEPRVGERVPYVIVYGSPGLPLIQLVRQPMEVLQDPNLRLNSTYYITKQILPPLHRFLSLLGVDVFTWYNEIPRLTTRSGPQGFIDPDNRKGTISQYFAAVNCPICDKQTKHSICPDCQRKPQMVTVTLNSKITHWERVLHNLNQICVTCSGSKGLGEQVPCVSLDCPIMYRGVRARQDVKKGEQLRDILAKVFS